MGALVYDSSELKISIVSWVSLHFLFKFLGRTDNKQKNRTVGRRLQVVLIWAIVSGPERT
jgi:hypothetical protein